MSERKPISKKTRFEIFKRDSFTCQYCGKTSPNVVLEIDHIKPIAEGGNNDILNLITACYECNRGKGKRELKDTTVITKQHEQLKELQDRKEQLEMMLEWKQELLNLENETVNLIIDFLETNHLLNWSLGEIHIKKIRRWVKEFEFNTLIDAINIAFSRYDNEETAFNKIAGIAHNKTFKQPEYLKELYSIRLMLKKKYGYLDEKEAIVLMRQAYEKGIKTSEIKHIGLNCYKWTQFRYWIQEFIKEGETNNG